MRNFIQEKNTLDSHKMNRHDGIRHQCDKCDYEATLKSNMKVHKQAMHEGISYNCDLCRYVSSTSRTLSLHQKSKHQVIQNSIWHASIPKHWQRYNGPRILTLFQKWKKMELLGKPSFKKNGILWNFFTNGAGGSTGFHISYSELYLYSDIRSKFWIRIS